MCYELEWFNHNRVISLPCYVGDKELRREVSEILSVNMGACGLAVTCHYLFQPMFAIFGST